MEASSLAARRAGDLAAIVRALAAPEPLDERAIGRVLRRFPKDGRGFYSKREILRAYRDGAWRPLPDAEFAARLRTCPTRTLSGVTPVTVLTRPFPCPGRCIFCPSDVRMPKSYLASEPGCQRAERNRFDPYLQTWNRLAAYRGMGHPTDKIELIVLGGTWSHHPVAYQRWFVARCFEAMTDFGEGHDARDAVATPAPRVPGLSARGSYNQRIAPLSRVVAGEEASWRRVEQAQRANEDAHARCVGLSLETRPDAITPGEVVRLRRLGATRIQLGLQSLSDAVLAANRRGHDVAASRRAMALLRRAGFKVHVHWMANLKGSDPARDRLDFVRLFDDADFRPDEVKIYPCSLVETADLMQDWRDGSWQPYRTDVLVDLLADVIEQVPRYCRVTRVIRDIPSPDIVVGNKRTNLREDVEARLAARGGRAREIRQREIRGHAVAARGLSLSVHSYAAGDGRECFVEACTPDGRLAGFARLHLPGVSGGAAAAGPAELEGAALLREVHVYGAQVGLGARAAGRAQHAGLGTRLVDRAASLAGAAGYERLAVISAVGTRVWYRRLGFSDGALYQHRATAPAARSQP